VISEDDFHLAIRQRVEPLRGTVRSVSGPGRSGALAAVYASHLLRVPFIPHGTRVPETLQPHLVIDTTAMSGRTLRKAARKMGAEHSLSVFTADHRLRFWYEGEER
jgi:hypothetical protein